MTQSDYDAWCEHDRRMLAESAVMTPRERMALAMNEDDAMRATRRTELETFKHALGIEPYEDIPWPRSKDALAGGIE